ncbi:MAG: hypothetical protein D4R43_00655 [Sphingobacteriales bacterium]|nr:MAG: hypothetical protein D4R43_00655 [Sphingobacteriales bacterium]
MKKIFLLLSVFISIQAKSEINLFPYPVGLPINTINTAVPFLRITPDACTGGMGDAGISNEPDIHSVFWNTSKLIFSKNNFGISASYTPWLKELVNDIFLSDLSVFQKIDSVNAITASARYFSLGNITFTDIYGHVLGHFNPREFTTHIGYSRKLAANFSTGINLGYVYSNLAAGQSVSGIPIKAGTAAMVDLSFTYSHPFKQNSIFKKYNFGLAISNFGNKISYTQNLSNRDFLPANLGIGSSFQVQFNEITKISICIVANRLLVPTPDSTGNFRNKSVMIGALQSFNDAPGGFAEELSEINYSAGVEYILFDRYFFRVGYFYEYPNKGNRQYATVGAGFRFHFLKLDVSNLFPTSNQSNPLDNTFRISLSMLFPNRK